MCNIYCLTVCIYTYNYSVYIYIYDSVSLCIYMCYVCINECGYSVFANNMNHTCENLKLEATGGELGRLEAIRCATRRSELN